jgi:histone H3/H4
MIIKKEAVRRFVSPYSETETKEKGKRRYSKTKISMDFYSALDDEIKRILIRAQERAKANNRKTLMVCDL